MRDKVSTGNRRPCICNEDAEWKVYLRSIFIIAIAGRSAFGDEFDTNATYEILVRLTELNTGNAIDLYGMTFNPKDYIVHSKGGTTYCYFNESAEINDIVLPTDPISANSKYVLKTLVRKKETPKPKWFVQNMTPVYFEEC